MAKQALQCKTQDKHSKQLINTKAQPKIKNKIWLETSEEAK